MKTLFISKVVVVLVTLAVGTSTLWNQPKQFITKPTGSDASQKEVVDTTDHSRESHLFLLAKSYGDSIVLRWAPDKAGAWITYNAIGYIVERRDISDSNNRQPSFTRLTQQALKPWAKERMIGTIKEPKENIYFAIAAQCLYGKVSVPNVDQTGSQTLNLLRNAADELSNKYSYSLFAADNNALAANALGLRWSDVNVKLGGKYVYRVFPAKVDPDYTLDTSYFVVDCEPRIIEPAPMNLSAVGSEKRVRLKWDNYPKGSAFSGFHVYRKDTKTGETSQLTQVPIVPMVNNSETQSMPGGFEDSTITENYRPYEYSVRGVTTFGDLSEPSTIVAMGRDGIPPPAPTLKQPLILGKNLVRLEWEMSDVPRDLKGYYVAKGKDPDKTFELITKEPIPANQMFYLDTTANIDERYYIVGAVDTSGNVSPALPIAVDIMDSLPPTIPLGFNGDMDTNGVVSLSWNLGSEKDLLGYRILWANDSTHEFSQRRGDIIQDTTFLDSTNINTGTPYIYYKLVAVDTRYMHSNATAILAVRRTDKVAPETPVISHVFVSDTSITLRYIQCRSDDFSYSVLERKEESATEWKEIARPGRTDGQFIDSKVSKLKRYHYQMIAVDSAGNKSAPSPAVAGRPYDAGLLSPARNIKASYDSTTKSIRVVWESPAKSNPSNAWYVIYRGYEGYETRQYRSVDNKTFLFEDKNLHAAGRYRYAVSVYSPLGQSPLTEEIEVSVR